MIAAPFSPSSSTGGHESEVEVRHASPINVLCVNHGLYSIHCVLRVVIDGWRKSVGEYEFVEVLILYITSFRPGELYKSVVRMDDVELVVEDEDRTRVEIEAMRRLRCVEPGSRLSIGLTNVRQRAPQ